MKITQSLIVAGIAAAMCLTSCSPHFRAKGLTERDSSYIITAAGKRFDAQWIKTGVNYAEVDGKRYTFDELAAVKSKAEYTVYNSGDAYYCLIYGKLNLLGQIGSSYTYNAPAMGAIPGSPSAMGGFRNSQSLNYYLQRQNSPYIDPLTVNNLIEYTADNRDAVRKAKAAKIWGVVTYASLGTFLGGMATGFIVKDKSTKFTSAVFMAGLYSIPVFFVSIPIHNHKIKKAIKLYNR